jgi:hypothetical protein
MSKQSTWIRIAVAVFVVAALALAARAGGGSLMDTLRRMHGH